MDEQIENLKRALAYPYSIPPASYALVDGRATPLDTADVDLSARLSLLAYGSNAAPEVLARKLGAGTEPVAVIAARLADFDVVYSAHISAYGAVPATIQRSPGTEVSLFVAHLTGEQLVRVSETEPNYELRSISGAGLRGTELEAPSEPVVYVSRHGCLVDGAGEVALSSIGATGRRFPALSEPQVLERVRRRLCPELSLEEFVGAALSDPGFARRWTERLRASAVPLDFRPAG